MGAAIGLGDDFDGAALRRLARATRFANQGRRLLALAEICDGASRSDAARIGGVGLQIVRDWVMGFNARGPDGLLDGKAPGKRSVLNDAQRRALVKIVETGSFPLLRVAQNRARKSLELRRPLVQKRTGPLAEVRPGEGLGEYP